jgi:hypothetical protein
MRKIAIVEDGYIRDSQVYVGNPEDINDDTNWEDEFMDVKNPCQYLGIFEGVTPDEIKAKAAEYFGVHPEIISLLDVEGGFVNG